MNATTQSKVTVTVSLDPGEWVVTSEKGTEVAVVRVEVDFHDGRRSDFLDATSVKRKKDGAWGQQGGGFVWKKWPDMPEAVRDAVMAAYREHLTLLP